MWRILQHGEASGKPGGRASWPNPPHAKASLALKAWKSDKNIDNTVYGIRFEIR